MTTVDTDRDLEIRRLIHAPLAAVWDTWADPVQLAQWWIPARYRAPIDAFGRGVHREHE